MALEVSGSPVSMDLISAVDAVLVAYGAPRRHVDQQLPVDSHGKEDRQNCRFEINDRIVQPLHD